MTRRAPRRGPSWPAALLVAAAIAGLVASVTAASAPARVAAPIARAGTTEDPQPVSLRPPLRAVATSDDVTAPAPTRLVVPEAGVDSRLAPLGLLPDGAMEVPADAAVAGWYELGPVPGEPGPAVVAGHVDSKTGPGVFFALRRLRPGDRVTVERDDGTRHVFAVTAVEQHPKTGLPVERIWAPSDEPVLRLVTCGGVFDPETGHYTDNLVVFAELVTSTAPQASLQRS